MNTSYMKIGRYKDMAASVLCLALTTGSSHAYVPQHNNAYSNLNESFDKGRSGDQRWKMADNVFSQNNTIQHEAPFISTANMLNVIFSSLGLNVSDLERVLGVKRATIYNWRKDGDIRSEDNLNRLHNVYHIAKEIALFNTAPFGRLAKTVKINNMSYLDRWSAPVLDTNAIIQHAQSLANYTAARAQANHKRARELSDIDNLSGV